ncbi:hypothetical protein GCM10023142_38460 [Anaerocolumna aminovalerica]
MAFHPHEGMNNLYWAKRTSLNTLIFIALNSSKWIKTSRLDKNYALQFVIVKNEMSSDIFLYEWRLVKSNQILEGFISFLRKEWEGLWNKNSEQQNLTLGY